MFQAWNHAHILIGNLSDPNEVTVVAGRNHFLLAPHPEILLPLAHYAVIKVLNELHDLSAELLVLFLIEVVVIRFAVGFTLAVSITLAFHLLYLREF